MKEEKGKGDGEGIEVLIIENEIRGKEEVEILI